MKLLLATLMAPALAKTVVFKRAEAKPENAATTPVTTSQQQLMGISDLSAFGSSTSAIDSFWNSLIGAPAQGWCINSDESGTVGHIYGQNPCQYWSAYAYKNLGTQKNRYFGSPTTEVIDQQMPVNCGSTSKSYTITLSGTESVTANLQTDSSNGLTWDGGVNLSFNDNSQGFSFSTTVNVGDSGSYSSSNSVSQTITVNVPARSYVGVYLVANKFQGSVTYELPATVSGTFYSYYDPSYNGYNYWYSGINYAISSSDVSVFGVATVQAYYGAGVSISSPQNAGPNRC